MSDAEKRFVLELYLAGPEGVHKRVVTKFSKSEPDAVFNLEVRNIVQWENDKTGKPTFLVLSWQGDEVGKLLMQVAKNESRKRAPG